MGLFSNIVADERNNWSVFSKSFKGLNYDAISDKPWKQGLATEWDALKLTAGWALKSAWSPVGEVANTLGQTIADASNVGANGDANNGRGGQNNSGGPNNMYSDQAVGKFDSYSSFYTSSHANTLVHPPSDNVTLYAFNNIPITTNGTNTFGHQQVTD